MNLHQSFAQHSEDIIISKELDIKIENATPTTPLMSIATIGMVTGIKDMKYKTIHNTTPKIAGATIFCKYIKNEDFKA